jgi:hypothetical protein
MIDDVRWSQDHDPDPDPALTRMLRAAGGEAPVDAVDWERLHGRVMERAAGPIRRRSPQPGEWYEIAARWIPVAAAAVLVAVLLSGVMVATTPGALDPAETENQSPEAMAVARVVAAYPDDAVLASLMGTTTADELAEWSPE